MTNEVDTHSIPELRGRYISSTLIVGVKRRYLHLRYTVLSDRSCKRIAVNPNARTDARSDMWRVNYDERRAM